MVIIMALLSPLHSGYPGTPIALVFAIISAIMVLRFAIEFYKVRRKIITPKNPINDGRIGIIWIFFLIMAILSIWQHYVHST